MESSNSSPWHIYFEEYFDESSFYHLYVQDIIISSAFNVPLRKITSLFKSAEENVKHRT